MSATWAMGKALSELMVRHGQTMPTPALVPLPEPTSTPMLLSGLAATTDVDIERVQFAPFAFDPLPEAVPLRFDRTESSAGRIELLAHNDRGELLTIRAYVDHPEGRCNGRCAGLLAARHRSPVVLRARRKGPASRDQPGACAGRPQHQGSAARAAVTDVRVWRRHPTSQSSLKA